MGNAYSQTVVVLKILRKQLNFKSAVIRSKRSSCSSVNYPSVMEFTYSEIVQGKLNQVSFQLLFAYFKFDQG